MGYLKHDTIVVTDWSADIEIVREEAIKIFEAKNEGYSRIISPLVGSVINSQKSFFIAPDGSKEGWSDSNLAEEARVEFLDWLRKSKYFCDYVLIRFGGDDEYDEIVRSKDKDLDNDDFN